MSHRASTWAVDVVEDSDLTVSARYVLLLLADAHNGHNGDCFPSLNYLMRKTGLSESAVKVAIRQLEAVDLLDRKILPHNDGRRTKGVQYNLHMERVRVRTPSGGQPDEGSADEPAGVRGQPPSKENRKENRKDNPSSLRSEGAGDQNLTGNNVVSIETARAKPERKTRLTEEFDLTPQRLAYAVEHGLSEEEAHHEFEKFQHHFIGSGTVKNDWHRTLLKWFLTASERGTRQAAYGSGGQAPATVFRATQRVIARFQALRGDDGGHEVDLPF